MLLPLRFALLIIGKLNIEIANKEIDAGVANLIKVSLSIMVKNFFPIISINNSYWE
tara:strand:- start:85 stop:252 length:168 start_codon:yes stop_codon:yes gene_type:complete